MDSVIPCGPASCRFAENGMLRSMLLPEAFAFADLLRTPVQLKLTRQGGEEFFAAAQGETPERWRSPNGAEILEYTHLGFARKDGSPLPGFKLTLRHELFPDGTCFTDAFLLGEEETKKEICGFELSLPLALRAFDPVRWGLSYRPRKTDGALIQTSAPERELPPGEDRSAAGSIFPLLGFYFRSKEGPAGYAEFFMEGDNVLAGDPRCNSSSIQWEEGDPVIRWDFQTRPVRPASGPWQWRNRWGFVVAAAPEMRRFPPLAMYHYFDNINRYPSDETLQGIADSGAKVLILHENWRLDVQNGGVPYDPARFREVIDFAHRHGIRVMVYTRGSEESLNGEDADWFSRYLKPDYDGLYMDYGGPFHNQTPPSESFQGGRICFRDHYFLLRKCRKVVGEKGLFYSHTGPMFSALGMTGGNVDGYVSGEGERGLLVRSPLDHAYFSMAAVCSGTMWTAAFPEYSSPVMIPYLAAAGQSPHVPLGVQFPSSSLAHPPVPGIGDRNFRPLWKLWNLLHGAQNVRVLCDYNCRGVFPRSPGIAHYLMTAENKTVCLFANLTNQSVSVPAKLDREKAGIPAAQKAFLCLPDAETPGKAAEFQGDSFELAPCGVGALVWGESDFAEYEKEYPPLSRSGRKYLEYVEEQRQLRQGKGTAPEWFLHLRVQDLPVPYEESMIVDLYDNRFELNEITAGKRRRIGYLGKRGFQKEETKRGEFVMNGEESPWIALRPLLGPGKHDLEIRSLHRGDLYYVNVPFYSFIEVDVARKAGSPEYRLNFLNELETDRSCLHFFLELEPSR